MDWFDWKAPDYDRVYQERVERLTRLRAAPEDLPALRHWYASHPADFINDWGMTYDPRLAAEGRAEMPFVLFPAQREWCDWVFANWQAKEDILSDKSRDMGLSWLAIGIACTLALHWQGFRAGFGSRLSDYVDKTGDPKSLFWKGRYFISKLPREFRPGWDIRIHAPYMRLLFPETGASITGEGGDGIGRGDRTSMYVVDESAHLERPQLVDAALSATTDFRLDISSANGMGNPFAQKRHSWPASRIKTMHWKKDPRKDEAWYQKQQERLDPVVLAQEVDIDYTASVSGIVIPGIWVRSAIGAAELLGIAPTGAKAAALDVADEGKDKNALAGGQGIILQHLAEWTGAGSDIFATTERAFTICDEQGFDELLYDADGMGADVRGDARVINERRRDADIRHLTVTAFRGSEGVLDPEGEDTEGRLNKDYFANRKAQAWWRLRKRFELTHKAVMTKRAGVVPQFDPDALISIDPSLPLLDRLVGELSQPTYTLNGAGKILIDKTPPTTRSPNLADGVMMRYSGVSGAILKVSTAAVTWARNLRRR